MVLHHVLQRAVPVVVPGAALERERLLPEDLDLLDVGAVPDGLQHPVREPKPEQVLHGRHPEHVVDPEHHSFARRPGHLREQPVERDRALQVLAEGLLHDDPAARREPRLAERDDRGGEDARRQREVDGARRGIQNIADDARSGLRAEVDLPIPKSEEQVLTSGFGYLGGVPLKLFAGATPERLIAQLLPGRADHLERAGELAQGTQLGEGGKQKPAGEVPGGAE